MQSVRLTHYYRDKIIEQVLAYKFKKEDIQAYLDEFAVLANDVYLDIFAKELPKMKEIPSDWLPSASGFKVKFGAEITQLEFNGYVYNKFDTLVGYYGLIQGPEAVHKTIPAYASNRILYDYDATHRFSERFVDINTRLREYVNNHRQAKSMVKKVVYKATTTKILINNWPESEPFIKAVFGEASPIKASVPAIPVDRINSIIGLPVPEKKAA